MYGKNKTQFPPVVDGQSSKQGIANAFQRLFEANCKPNNISKVEELNSRFNLKYQEFSQNHLHNCDCAKFHFSLDSTIDTIFSMTQGKCGDDDGLQAGPDQATAGPWARSRCGAPHPTP